MIKVDNVSMKFNLGMEAGSFKETFISLFDKNRRVSKTKNEFWALKDVSFEVEKGEVVGIIGSNGAGKSTLLKVISGVMKPTKGSVEVKGAISPMIELGAGFDQELTARENIYLNGAILGYSKDFIDEKFDEIVEFSELQKFLDVPVKNFSSGMVAKLAFSIATIVNPEILIVDEILSVGDIKFQEKSRNKMMEMITGGTTVLYVSHSLESIKELCTKVVWLEHGIVQKVGDPKELCAEYYYHMLYDDQTGAEKSININKVTCKDKTISYDYEISDNLKPFFKEYNKLQLDYSTDISKVPYEVAVIPFITGILPMIFLENIKVYVDKIDKDFYESIDGIRNAYKKLFPKGNWKGRIIAKEIVDLNSNAKIGNTSMFYSGGVNSTQSAILHKKEQPDFVFVYGSDILQDNTKSINITKKFLEESAKTFNSKLETVSSNFRLYLNENALTTKYRSTLPVSWWHDVQHGIALIGHVAPLAYINNYAIHYISTNNNNADIIATNPTIVESIKFCGCKVAHEGNKYRRIDKINDIVEFKKASKIKELKLRVCFTEEKDEINCSSCEKCYRTICEIIACKGKPNEYGFTVTDKQIEGIEEYLKENDIEEKNIKFWEEIKDYTKEDESYFKKTKMSWILNYDFDNMNVKDFSHEVWNMNGEKVETSKK